MTTKPGWLTKEFIEAKKTGDVLPDGTIYVRDRKGAHWAMAAYVSTPKLCGYKLDLGSVGEFITEQNSNQSHGHADWELLNSDVGLALSDARKAGALKKQFAFVWNLWLNELIDDDHAAVLLLESGHKGSDFRGNYHSVCAVRKLEI